MTVSEEMLPNERGQNEVSQHRTSQDWGLWRRSQEVHHDSQHFHKPHYVKMRELSPQLCYSSLDLGLDYRKVRLLMDRADMSELQVDVWEQERE